MNIHLTQNSSPLAALQAGDRAGVLAGTRPAQIPTQDNVSVAAMVLLSALAVTLTIIGVLLLGAVMVGAWWLISHIPVPPIVWRLVHLLQMKL
jgi:hypothetical protein